MNNYYDDSDVTARYGYKVAEDPTVVSGSIQYSVLPQRLRTGSKSATAANHWEK